MLVSRRAFLGTAAVTPMLASSDRLNTRYGVMDLGCVLPESLAGFTLQAGDCCCGDGGTDVLIVPRVGTLSSAGVQTIQRCLERGATVLLECGLGIPANQAVYFPYVEYVWPVKVKIREFTPVCIEPAPADEIIGTFAGKPVAVRRRVGDGTLVAIGSALGPIFLTGDPDARRWLDGLHTS
jgi:hypothetical protein